MKIATTITGYDHDDLEASHEVESVVINHWNRNDVFGLVIDGETAWFRRGDFEKAVQNACNHGY